MHLPSELAASEVLQRVTEACAMNRPPRPVGRIIAEPGCRLGIGALQCCSEQIRYIIASQHLQDIPGVHRPEQRWIVRIHVRLDGRAQVPLEPDNVERPRSGIGCQLAVPAPEQRCGRTAYLVRDACNELEGPAGLVVALQSDRVFDRVLVLL